MHCVLSAKTKPLNIAKYSEKHVTTVRQLYRVIVVADIETDLSINAWHLSSEDHVTSSTARQICTCFF